MRKFTGVSNIYMPEAVSSYNAWPIQVVTIKEKDECNPGRTGMNIQPYRTEFRNIYK